MKNWILILCVAIALPVFGQEPVDISIPTGNSWLLTGGGEGQDDAPAPFLPATAIIQNRSNQATIRIMDSMNSRLLRSYQLLSGTTARLIVQDGERLLVDAEQNPVEIGVSYDCVPVHQVLNYLTRREQFFEVTPN